jgi:predicted metal-dependent phosphotriesterase family hydrolase
MADASVRTVLGHVAVATLGRTNYHEHLCQVQPAAVVAMVNNPARWLSGTKNETSGGNPR